MFTLIGTTALPTSRMALHAALLLVVIAGTACDRDGNPAAPAPQTPAADVAASIGPAPPAHSAAKGEAATLGYRCADDTACDLDALGARTIEEADWLIQKGYPSAEDLKAFAALSDEQLKKIADGGSLAAMVRYGERAAAKGDTKTGIGYIHDAIERGSLYGYYGMSSVYQHTPGLKNIVDAGAYLRVAYILGDAKAASELQRRFPGLTQVEQAAIDRRASSLYQTFAHSQQPSPRP